VNKNVNFQSHLFLLRLGLFKLFRIKSTCITINQTNIDIYKEYSQSDIDKILSKVSYLKVDDIKLDLNLIQKIESSRSIYKGNNSNQINYFINLDNGYDKYIEAMKSKHKKELRREVRRFYEAFESVDIVYFSKQDQVSRFMVDMQGIHNNSWKNGTLNELEINTVNGLVNIGSWLGVIIYGNGNPISYMHGRLSKDHEYLLINNGYVESTKNLKPGKVLISKIIENHSEFDIMSIDFGSGSSVYKKIFCNDSNDIYSSLISRKLTKFSLLFSLQIALDTLYSLVKRTSEKLNLDHKLRKIVRNR